MWSKLDGVYYLCNPMYPGVNIELNFTLIAVIRLWSGTQPA